MASRDFYTQVFAASFHFEDDVSAAMRVGSLVINVLARSEALGFVEPAPVAHTGAPASVMLTVNVDACALRVQKTASNLSMAPLTGRGVAALRCSSIRRGCRGRSLRSSARARTPTADRWRAGEPA